MSQKNENASEKSIPPAGRDPESISRRAFVGTVAAAGAAADVAAGGTLVDDKGNPTLDEEVMVSVLDFYSDCVGAADSGSHTIGAEMARPSPASSAFAK